MNDWDALIKKLRKQGFEVQRKGTRNGHHHHVHKDGKRVYTLPSTGSDWRGIKNAISALRKVGFKDR